MSLPHMGESELTHEPEDMDGGGHSSADATPTSPEDDLAYSSKRWDAAVWTEQILGQSIVQSSRDKLSASLREFIQEASPEEQKAHEESRSKVLSILKDVKEKHDAKYSPNAAESERRLVDSVKAACGRASETAYEYTKILDVMLGQAPEYVVLAYGAVKILLVTHINYMEMKENVSTWMKKIKSNFELVDHLTSYYPSKRLLDAIVRMYDNFQTFLAEALKFYTRSRLRHALTSFKKPWRALEPIVDSIEDTCTGIKDIIVFSTHYTGELNLRINQANLSTNKTVLTKLTRLVDLVEANVIRFANADDVHETGGLFRQSIEAKMEHHLVGNPRMVEEHVASDATSMASTNLDDHLSALFSDLVDFDAAAAQQQELAEELPEMEAHRKTKRSIWRVDRVMDWLEAKTSQLLWVDGGRVLQRQTFNASFLVPLLIFGDSNSETGCLVLRHFCGGSSIRPSNYRILIQALVRQLLKRRPDVWEIVASDLTEQNARDIRKLWDTFLTCIKVAAADYTFIVVDSIDCLVSDNSEGGIDEREFVIQGLDNLVKESGPLVKILLTTSLSQATQATVPSSSEAMTLTTEAMSTALISMSAGVIRQPRRSLSLSIFRNEMALLPMKLLEIQEKRCTTVRFAELPMLYPVNSTVYTQEDGYLRAFVISEVSGMDKRSVGSYDRYDPLLLLVWGIDHDGKTFIKRHDKFKIRQFAGEKKIDQLQYVPSGYLSDEHLHRRRLILRGRRYWELGSRVHHLQYNIEDTQRRVVIDQHYRQLPSRDLEDLDIYAYCLDDNLSRELDVLGFEKPVFQKNPLSRLILNDKPILRAAIRPFENLSHLAASSTLVLLHGGPGVGKTTAARYSAEHLQLPLIEISAGDIARLGADTIHMFWKVLEQAERWRAVLSLENADLLFPESTSGNLNDRDFNIMFIIKALEVHHGLVFLTTDRIGVFSSVLRARIHIPIGLPEFNAEMRHQLWSQLLYEYEGQDTDLELHNKIRVGLWDLSQKHSANMNGWDINITMNNAAKFAAAEGKILGWEHLQRALRIRTEIKNYMEDVYKGSEEQTAMRRQFRAKADV